MKKRTWPILACSALIIGGLAFTAGAATETAKTKADPAAGKTVYSGKCAACHGPKAEKSLNIKATDEEWFMVIKEGGKKHKKSAMMPAYSSMKDADIHNVIAYMRSLQKK